MEFCSRSFWPQSYLLLCSFIVRGFEIFSVFFCDSFFVFDASFSTKLDLHTTEWVLNCMHCALIVLHQSQLAESLFEMLQRKIHVNCELKTLSGRYNGRKYRIYSFIFPFYWHFHGNQSLNRIHNRYKHLNRKLGWGISSKLPKISGCNGNLFNIGVWLNRSSSATHFEVECCLVGRIIGINKTNMNTNKKPNHKNNTLNESKSKNSQAYEEKKTNAMKVVNQKWNQQQSQRVIIELLYEIV